MKSFDWKKWAMLFLHKIARYTKQQKLFVLYLFVLIFFMIVMPVVRISPADPSMSSRLVFMISGTFGMTALILFLSVIILLAWNTSFRFKNLVTAHFGFKENEYLFNFAFLWLMISLYISIGDTISIFRETTSIQVTNVGYNLILILLLFGLVLTLASVIKQAKTLSGNKIINIVSNPEERKEKAKTTVK